MKPKTLVTLLGMELSKLWVMMQLEERSLSFRHASKYKSFKLIQRSRWKVVVMRPYTPLGLVYTESLA